MHRQPTLEDNLHWKITLKTSSKRIKSPSNRNSRHLGCICTHLSGNTLARNKLLLFTCNPGFQVFYSPLFSFKSIFQVFYFIHEIVYFMFIFFIRLPFITTLGTKATSLSSSTKGSIFLLAPAPFSTAVTLSSHQEPPH